MERPPRAASDKDFDLRVNFATRRISLSGEVDLSTAANLATAVAAVQRVAAGDITIDLAGVSFIDVAGLGAIAGARSALAERGAAVVVTGANALVSKVFILGSLDELLLGNDEVVTHDVVAEPQVRD